MLYQFLTDHRDEILALTEKKTITLAGPLASSRELKEGLPAFFKQLLTILKTEQPLSSTSPIDLGREAGLHGKELLRLGYTLSHVVHAYGAMCQAITEIAAERNAEITAHEFHILNRCLDIAIAGAVTEYQALSNSRESSREVEHLGALAHELRNALTGVKICYQLIKGGTVGFGGNTSQALERGLKRFETLIEGSMIEVRLRVDPQTHPESGSLLEVVNQIVLTAENEARLRNQTLVVQIDPNLVFEADQQFFYSALSNLVQNAIKFTRVGGQIQIRGGIVKNHLVVEVEDECGGLAHPSAKLFKAFEQHNENREGLGLGLTIVSRAIALNHGTVEVRNLVGKGCIFNITLPQGGELKEAAAG